MFLVVVGIERRIGHEMEGEELHGATPAMKSVTVSTNSSAQLDMRDVAAVFDDMQPRARDQRGVRGPMRWRDELVVVTPNEQRRHADAVQPLVQMRIVEPRMPAEFRGGELVFGVGHQRVVRDRLRERGLRELLVVIEVADQLLARPHEQVAFRHTLHMNADRRRQRQRREPLATAHRDFRCDPAAERGSDEMDAGRASARRSHRDRSTQGRRCYRAIPACPTHHSPDAPVRSRRSAATGSP